MSNLRSIGVASAAFMLGVTTFGIASAHPGQSRSAPQLAPVLNLAAPQAIPNHFIVTLRSNGTDADVASTRGAIEGMGGLITSTYHSWKGFAVTLPTAGLQDLRALPAVASIEADVYAADLGEDAPGRLVSDKHQAAQTRRVGPDLVQLNPPNWGLDRIDQRVLPLDHDYTYELDGTGVTVYIVDTGVTDQPAEFGGRLLPGIDFTGQAGGTTDLCRPHGTEIAGIIGSASYGVAKNVFMKSVRVRPCGAGVEPPLQDLLDAVDWINLDDASRKVVYFGAGVDVDSEILDQQVRDSMAAGVTYIATSGENKDGGPPPDLCSYSPQGLDGVITVSASDKFDQVPIWANQGVCLSMFAPGDKINSVHLDGSMYERSSGGMAAAHVAGIAALYLQNSGFVHPIAVRYSIVPAAVANVFNVDTGATTGVLRGVPNLLANASMSDLFNVDEDDFPAGSQGETHYYPQECGVQTKSQHIFIGSLRSTGPAAGTDFDLRLERLKSGTCLNGNWTGTSVRASGSDSTAVWEDLTFTASKGRYRWAVVNFTNTGASYVFRSSRYEG